jgi:hypothetical protein
MFHYDLLTTTAVAGGISRLPLRMIDIKNSPQTIEAINAILNAKNIAEVKIEPKGVAVIEIKRQVKSIEKTE